MIWQPIETAPKDGTWVLIAGGSADVYHDDRNEPPMVAACYALNPPYADGDWVFCSYDGGYYGRWVKPTHWMPLPEAPEC